MEDQQIAAAEREIHAQVVQTSREEAEQLARKMHDDMDGTLYADHRPFIRQILRNRFYRQLGRADHGTVIRAYYELKDELEQS